MTQTSGLNERQSLTVPERRITNHAVVAMIEDQVKQTRCTTCDADHEYKQARVPAPRRKKDGVEDYRRIAQASAALFKEFGALSVVECLADDTPFGERTSFRPQRYIAAGELRPRRAPPKPKVTCSA